MSNDLDHMLQRLGDAPLDRSLDGLTGDIGAAITAHATTERQTWGLRAAAALLVTTTGIVISAPPAAVAAPELPSAFSVWSELAPSTLLEHGR